MVVCVVIQQAEKPIVVCVCVGRAAALRILFVLAHLLEGGIVGSSAAATQDAVVRASALGEQLLEVGSACRVRAY